MKKAECIERYGEEEWERLLDQGRAWAKENQEKVKAKNQEAVRKGGKRYDKMLEAQRTGLQGERHRIRMKHAKQYRPFKQIIAPDSQLHHEWIPDTSEYRGIALVETDQHMHGFVDVIEILDGEITLRIEEQIRKRK